MHDKNRRVTYISGLIELKKKDTSRKKNTAPEKQKTDRLLFCIMCLSRGKRLKFVKFVS